MLFNRGTDRPRPAAEALAVIGAFTALTLAVTYPLVHEMTRALPSDLGDPLLNAWILAWDAEQFLHGLQGLWDAPIFYPYPKTLTYSENLLGIAVLTAPVQWLTGNPVLGYNVAFLFSYVLAGSGMYLLAVSITGNRLAAVVSGVAFAFLPYRVAQLPHLQMLMFGWMPIGLWALHRFFRSGSRSVLAIFVVAFLLQGLSNLYFLYFFTLPVALVIAFELIRRPPSWGRRVVELAVASVLILLVLAPVGLAYYEVHSDYGLVRTREDMHHYSADVTAYMHPPSSLVLWGDVLPRARPEAALFPGFVLLFLAALGLVAVWMQRRVTEDDRTRLVRGMTTLYTAVGAAAFVLTLGPAPTAWGHQLLSSGPWDWLLAVIPGFDGMRVPSRMAVVVYLALAVMAATGTAAIVNRLSRRVGATACLLISVAVIAEGYRGPMPYRPFEPHLERDDQEAYEWFQTAPPGAILELPVQAYEPINTLRFMYRTLQHKHPIVNGYSGYTTRLFHYLSGSRSPLYDLAQFDDALRGLRALGVRYIVLHETQFGQREFARATRDAIRRHPDQLVGIVEFGTTTVFWLAAERQPLPEAPPGLRQVPLSSFTARSSHANRQLVRAFDEDLDTRWLSGQQQTGTEWIEIRFDRVRNLGRVRLDMADRSLGDYPRGLLIESSENGQSFRTLYQGGVLPQLLWALVQNDDRIPIDIILPDNDTSVLRIQQTDQTSPWYWSIHELSLWER